MKKALAFAMALVLVCFAASAGEKAIKDIKLGLSMKQQTSPYFTAQIEIAKDRAKEMGFTLIALDAQGNMEKQIADVDDLLAQNVDALLINAIDPEAIVPATRAATRAGVPVIGFDTLIDPSGEFVTVVLSNNFENGRAVGAYAAQFYQDKPVKAAVLSGTKGNTPGRDRRTGFFTGFIEQELLTKGKCTLELQVQGWGDWGQEEGLKAMEDIVVAYPDINMLIAENDNMALGAMKAIAEAGMKDQIRIFAVCDGQKEAMALIKNNNEGNYMATGMNDPALVANTAIDVALEIVQKGASDMPKIYYTPPVAVTKENVDKYYRPNAIF